MKRLLLAVPLLALVAFTFARAQDATTQSAVISVSDKDALTAAKDTETTIEGKIEKAEWSKSGKVFNIDFADNTSGVLVALFEKSKTKFEEAFGGDLGTTLTGSKVRIKGKIGTYGGKSPAYEGRLQIVLSQTSQLTIVEPAAGATTAPTSAPAN